MSYVICRHNSETRRTEYVAPPGSRKSFTPFITQARRFTTRAEAEADACPENERVVAI